MNGRRIWVAGHTGLVGSAVIRQLQSQGEEVLTTTRDELDLRRQEPTERWLRENRPDAIIIAAAHVGGIHANNAYPAQFIYDNLAIASNIVHGAHLADINRVVYLGSSCIYPKFAQQPITEDALLTGALEPTNQWYAVAKIAGIRLCQAYRQQYGRRFISLMPCNLYGPNDHYDLMNSHVLPALMRKFHEAKQMRSNHVVIWGSGSPRREFLYVDDLARAIVFCLDHYDGDDHINCGAGSDVTIREAAEIMREVVGFDGALQFDASKPDGAPRKLMNSERLLTLGWRPLVSLKEGLQRTYEWVLANPAVMA